MLCYYFYKGFQPSIRLWINKKGRDLDSWNTLIKKAIWAKAKAKIQTSACRDLHQYYYQSNLLIYTLAAKAQALKNLQLEELKPQGPELLTTPQCSNNLELDKKARQEKKKDYRGQDQQQQP